VDFVTPQETLQHTLATTNY